MVTMTNMRRTAAERKTENGGDGMPDSGSGRPASRDDVEVRLEHHHIQKLGLDGPLPHGTKVEFGGHGEVADSGTTEGYSDGEPRHHMTIRLRRAGVDAAERPDDRRGELRGDIQEAADKVASKDAGTGGGRADRKIAEKTGA